MGVGGQRHAPAALSSVKIGTHCLEGWVDPGDSVWTGAGNLASHRDSTPGLFSP